MSHDVETSGGWDDGGEVVGDHAHFAAVLLECRRLCCCQSKLCGRQADSESVYCCCIRSVCVSEKEVGGFAVSGGAVRAAGKPAAEWGAGVGLEVVVE